MEQLAFAKEVCIAALVIAILFWGWALAKSKDWKAPSVAIGILLTMFSAISFAQAQPIASLDQFLNSGIVFPTGATVGFLIGSIIFDIFS